MTSRTNFAPFSKCKRLPIFLALFLSSCLLLCGVFLVNVSNEEEQQAVNDRASFYCSPSIDFSPRVDIEAALRDLEKDQSWTREIQSGGSYIPNDCTPREKVAILIPYRNRSEHLRIFNNYMHPFLIKQRRHYTIYVISQTDEFAFNRGALFNAGVREVIKRDKDVECFFLHDVDTIPLDTRLVYECSSNKTAVRMLANYQSKWNYKFGTLEYVGGVMAIRRDQFLRTNGFSNCYWTWGGEDNDFGFRIKRYKLAMDHEVSEIARYYNMAHTPEDTVFNNNRLDLIHYAERLGSDGLSSIRYTVEDVVMDPLYTRIDVALDFYNMRQNCSSVKRAAIFKKLAGL